MNEDFDEGLPKRKTKNKNQLARVLAHWVGGGQGNGSSSLPPVFLLCIQEFPPNFTLSLPVTTQYQH